MTSRIERFAGWLNVHVLWRRGWGIGRRRIGSERERWAIYRKEDK